MTALQVRAQRVEPLGRWLWLVKWLLLLPHLVVLAVLWVGFVALTFVAYVAVLFTGRYPRAVYEFNVGVLRWSWRVGYYGYQVLGTDRYPPFTLAEVPDYPAGLLVAGPPVLPRWRPLVAWLFAIPHLLILSALTGTATWPSSSSGPNYGWVSVVGIGVLVAAVSLAVRGRSPQGLYDLLVGAARWSLRVVAYVALLTAEYPPFRLDQGDVVPGSAPVAPASARPENELTGPVGPAGQPSPAARPGRVLAFLAGVFLLVTSIGAGVAGGCLLILGANRDGEGYVTSPTVDLTSPTAAITAEGINLTTTGTGTDVLGGYGQVRITVSSRSSTPLFVGIARQSDVDGWLAGAGHDRLAGIYRLTGPRYDRTAGPLDDLEAPSTRDFWLAKASGTGTVVLNWRASDGQFSVVVANATGGRGVVATARVAARIPQTAPLGGGLIGGALLVALAAFVLIYLGAAGLAPRAATATSWGPGGA